MIAEDGFIVPFRHVDTPFCLENRVYTAIHPSAAADGNLGNVAGQIAVGIFISGSLGFGCAPEIMTGTITVFLVIAHSQGTTDIEHPITCIQLCRMTHSSAEKKQ